MRSDDRFCCQANTSDHPATGFVTGLTAPLAYRITNIIHSPNDPVTSSTISESEASQHSAPPEGRFNRPPKFDLRRLKAKQSSANVPEVAPWTVSGDYCWKNSNGVEVTLTGTKVQCLSPVERQAVQKVAMARIQRANLGCTIVRPKDILSNRNKRHKYVKRKSHTVNLIGQQEALGSAFPLSKKTSTASGKSMVFGIPLSQCLLNDQSRTSSVPITLGVAPAGTSTSQEENTRCKSLDLDEMETLQVIKACGPRLSGDSSRSSAKSSKSSLSEQGSSVESTSYSGGPWSKQSSEGTEGENADQVFTTSAENLISMSVNASPTRFFSGLKSSSSTPAMRQDLFQPHTLAVPLIVQSCCDYLESCGGLSTVGLFRVAGSVKRCRELRYVMDSGRELATEDLTDSPLYPHDIASLLKEYFRDLPNPLLTKELYSGFIAAAKLPTDQRIEILRYLIALLPATNADTLFVLLQFLQQVDGHSYDTISDEGISTPGNKMDAYNLATVFAPTILRPPSSSKAIMRSDNDYAITAVESLIKSVDDVFTIPRDLQMTAYRLIADHDVEGLNYLLTRIHKSNVIGADSSSSGDAQHTTIYYSSQEEIFPNELLRDTDGSTVLKTRQTTTHRIIYRVRKGNSSSEVSSSDPTLDADDDDDDDDDDTPNAISSSLGHDSLPLEDRFPDLRLIDENSGSNTSTPATTPDIIDPASIVRLRPKHPVSPLARFGHVRWPQLPRHETSREARHDGL